MRGKKLNELYYQPITMITFRLVARKSQLAKQAIWQV